MLTKFRYIANFRYASKISLHSKNFTCSEIVCFMFLCSNNSVLINFISTLNVIMLFLIDWYFHLVVRLYKPSYEQFVKKLFILKHFYYGPCFQSSLSLFSLLFLSLSRQSNTPFEDDNSKDVWLKPLNLEEEGC